MTSLRSGPLDCVYRVCDRIQYLVLRQAFGELPKPFVFVHSVRNQTREVSVMKFPFGTVLFVIAGSRREVKENCAILGFYAASSGKSYRRFGTVVRKYHSLRTNPEERSYQYILLHIRYSFPGAFSVYVSLTAVA